CLKAVTHVTRERVYLVYILMTECQLIGVITKNMLKRARVKKGQNFELGALTRFRTGMISRRRTISPLYDPGG
ncbi:hypothetical protein HAX54_049134, partial [Datura stramonium]|nr:hypothetical protein [Datura stramonium]